MFKIQKLYHGSKNPPLEKSILVKTIWGDWGIGKAYKDKKGIYFEFDSHERTLLGEDKKTFVAWTNLPE